MTTLRATSDKKRATQVSKLSIKSTNGNRKMCLRSAVLMYALFGGARRENLLEGPCSHLDHPLYAALVSET